MICLFISLPFSIAFLQSLGFFLYMFHTSDTKEGERKGENSRESLIVPVVSFNIIFLSEATFLLFFSILCPQLFCANEERRIWQLRQTYNVHVPWWIWAAGVWCGAWTVEIYQRLLVLFGQDCMLSSEEPTKLFHFYIFLTKVFQVHRREHSQALPEHVRTTKPSFLVLSRDL